MVVDESRFDVAIRGAAPILDGPEDVPYDATLYIEYAKHIITEMGGRGPGVEACAREIYDEWAACRHFELYDEVPAVLRELVGAGIRLGLISNSHRRLDTFQSHFDLQGLITATVSSSEHGFMKPHPNIFSAALRLVDVPAAAAVMVGDSLRHDVEGALGAGMRAVLLHRGPEPHPRTAELLARGVPVVASLRELPGLLIGDSDRTSPEATEGFDRPVDAGGCERQSGRRPGSC